VLLEVDAGDWRSADGAGLREPVVDAIGLLVARAAQPQLEALGEGLPDRRRQAGDLVLVEFGGQSVRRETGAVEDLIRPGAADAGERTLVAQKRMEPARVRAQDLPGAFGVFSPKAW
jgi:hypothetical protein